MLTLGLIVLRFGHRNDNRKVNMITLQEFNKIADDFIAASVNFQRSEWYTTKNVMDSLRVYLFEAEVSRDERYKQFLALKEEFEA